MNGPNVNSNGPGAEGNRQDEKEAGSLALQPVEPPPARCSSCGATGDERHRPWCPGEAEVRGCLACVLCGAPADWAAAPPPVAVPAPFPYPELLHKALQAEFDKAPAAVPAQPAEVPLPEPIDFGYRDEGGTWVQQFAFDAEQMRAYRAAPPPAALRRRK